MVSRAVAVDRPLTLKQRAFIDHFLVSGNATEAAVQAGYNGIRSVVARQGSQNLQNPKISAEIERLYREQHISASEVIARLSDHARGSMADFIDPETMTLDLKKARDAKKLHLIKKLKYTVTRRSDPTMVRVKSGDGEETEPATIETETETVELELYSAQDALKTLAQYHGLMVRRVQVADWRQELREVDPDALLKDAQSAFVGLFQLLAGQKRRLSPGDAQASNAAAPAIAGQPASFAGAEPRQQAEPSVAAMREIAMPLAAAQASDDAQRGAEAKSVAAKAPGVGGKARRASKGGAKRSKRAPKRRGSSASKKPRGRDEKA